jgi:predicted peroxiredoxin
MVKPTSDSVKSRRPDEPVKAKGDRPNASYITATIDAATGKIVEVLSLDEAGASSKLTTDRRTKLSKQSGDATLEDLFEQAFEAGIACVLGDDAEEAETNESEEDIALRRQILRQMIEHSAAQHLMRKEVLGRAIVRTLIQKSAA